jgi:hypothetical protein
MQNKDGVQKGPQDHAEGQHGSKTHSKFLEQLKNGNGNGATAEASPNGLEPKKNPSHSAHRLFEQRQQHDEAEKSSEKTRLNREIERRHLDPENLPKI